MVKKFSEFYHDPDEKYEAPDWYHDKSAKIHDKTPWHKFKRLSKESDDLIQVNPPRRGFIWGWDEATMKRLLGKSWNKYLEGMSKNKFSWVGMIFGPSIFIYRNIWGPALVGWLVCFIWALINVNIYEPVMFYVAGIVHVICGVMYTESYKVKFVTLMRKNARQYNPIPEDLSNWLNKRIGCNSIGLIASYIAYVILMIVLWKFVRGNWV